MTLIGEFDVAQDWEGEFDVVQDWEGESQFGPPDPCPDFLICDTFFDADGALIANHTPGKGGPWTQDEGAANQAYIDGYQLLLNMSTTGGIGGRAIIDGLGANGQMRVNMKIKGTRTLAWARVNPADKSGLCFEIDLANNRQRLEESDGVTFIPRGDRPNVFGYNDGDDVRLSCIWNHGWYSMVDLGLKEWLNALHAYSERNIAMTHVGVGERVGNFGPHFDDLYVAAPPAIGLRDEFTDVNGTSLVDHSPNIDENPTSGVWTPWTAGGPLPTGDIQGNRARCMDAGDGQWRGWEITTGLDEGFVYVRCFTNAVNPAAMGITFRGNGATRWTWFFESWTNDLVLVLPSGTQARVHNFVVNPGDEVWLAVHMGKRWNECWAYNANTNVGKRGSQAGSYAGLDWCGIFERTVFGGGAQDFFDNFQVQALPTLLAGDPPTPQI